MDYWKPGNLAAERERYRERIIELGEVLLAVSLDRELAIYRAHECGLPAEAIAEVAEDRIESVNDIIDRYADDPDSPYYLEGPDWRQTSRSGGWISGACS